MGDAARAWWAMIFACLRVIPVSRPPRFVSPPSGSSAVRPWHPSWRTPSRTTWPGTPEDLAAIEAHEGPLPQWMAEELDRRDREDAGTEDDGDVVMARLLAKHSPRRQSA